MFFAVCALLSACTTKQSIDVIVVGGGTSGIAAGIQSARMGISTMIVEETGWLGGMLTSAGVSAVDGNYRLRAGIWGEFLDSLANRYGGLEALKTGWVSNVLFEPQVGNEIFSSIALKESRLQLLKNSRIEAVERDGSIWHVTIATRGKTIVVDAKIVIDATELGDIAKMCGVGYDIGMESRHETGEDIAPEESNGIIQDLTYVAIVKDYGKDVTIPKPEGYNRDLYACCCENPLCVNPKEPDRVWSTAMMMSYGKLPGGKIMLNWPIEGNDFYANIIELSREERDSIIQLAKNHTLGYLYFIQKELGLSNIGLADDVFPTADKLPLIPYHRESRRIHGIVRYNLNHAMKPYEQPEKLYRTSIAVGDYPVDHHHARYTGSDTLPNLYFHPVPSFGVPLGVLIPQDVDGLIVAEKSISVSNIMNGATRLQPVVLQIGQAAGALAALAVQKDSKVSAVKVRDVQNVILEAGGYLQPYLDVSPDDVMFKALQRIGSTGILQAEGRNVDWSNETWIKAGEELILSDIASLKDYYAEAGEFEFTHAPISIEEFGKLIDYSELIEKYPWLSTDKNRHITRGEAALLIDEIIDPFNCQDVDLKGNILNR